ncbi:MAG: nuclear transport factor 2 family protein [Candidatus Thalassarchaeaceae archaeon]|nr:nuclear transport factor 2 family protein [Candidatus Thalassarchaeaceae archaeon]|tara:strand:- start:352 stop:684 length:333 start_codon:yes stop_codon:yes gene_type:complete
MSLYDTMAKAMDEKDAGMYTDLFHDDYEFVRHQTGTSMHREQMIEMMKMMMANEKVVIRDARCVYENNEILVEHSIMDFPDGTTEAVMSVHMLQDGKIIRTETGATLISK